MLGFLLSLYLTTVSAPIDITVTKACLEPCDVRVMARIQPHPLNRWWVVELYIGDKDMLVQSSMRQLEGERAPITQPEMWFRGLSQGEYQVTATLYRATVPSEAGRQTREVTVIGTQ